MSANTKTLWWLCWKFKNTDVCSTDWYNTEEDYLENLDDVTSDPERYEVGTHGLKHFQESAIAESDE